MASASLTQQQQHEYALSSFSPTLSYADAILDGVASILMPTNNTRGNLALAHPARVLADISPFLLKVAAVNGEITAQTMLNACDYLATSFAIPGLHSHPYRRRWGRNPH